MNVIKYDPPVYAPLYECPSQPGSREFYSYEHMRREASRPGYFTVKISQDIALGLASQSPYPDAVKVGIMKHLANGKGITLTQMLVFLGWAARRAQHTGR